MERPFARIVVPLDGSERARTTLRPAAAVARRASVSLTLLSAVTGITDRTIVEDELEAEAREGADDLLVETCVVCIDVTPAHAIIAEAATDRAVVCMGSHGHGGVGQLALGSVAAEVLRLTPSPVLVVGPAVDHRRSPVEGPLVACVDVPDVMPGVGHEALHAAAAWASTLDVPLWLVAVDTADSEASVQSAQDAGPGADRRLGRLAELLGPGTGWEVAAGDDAAREITRCAERQAASLVAMSFDGAADRQNAPGDVALQVVHHAPCPVLLVPSVPSGQAAIAGPARRGS